MQQHLAFACADEVVLLVRNVDAVTVYAMKAVLIGKTVETKNITMVNRLDRARMQVRIELHRLHDALRDRFFQLHAGVIRLCRMWTSDSCGLRRRWFRLGLQHSRHGLRPINVRRCRTPLPGYVLCRFYPWSFDHENLKFPLHHGIPALRSPNVLETLTSIHRH